MDFEVIFKDAFVADLERIIRSIAFHNPAAAQKLGLLIIQTAESLSFFPERHPSRGRLPATTGAFDTTKEMIKAQSGKR